MGEWIIFGLLPIIPSDKTIAEVEICVSNFQVFPSLNLDLTHEQKIGSLKSPPFGFFSQSTKLWKREYFSFPAFSTYKVQHITWREPHLCSLANWAYFCISRKDYILCDRLTQFAFISRAVLWFLSCERRRRACAAPMAQWKGAWSAPSSNVIVRPMVTSPV